MKKTLELLKEIELWTSQLKRKIEEEHFGENTLTEEELTKLDNYFSQRLGFVAKRLLAYDDTFRFTQDNHDVFDIMDWLAGDTDDTIDTKYNKYDRY